MESGKTDHTKCRAPTVEQSWSRHPTRFGIGWVLLMPLLLAFLIVAGELDASLAHGIGGRDASFVAATKGPDLLPFIYLGAKHMVTGYDHLLFIFSVIFFLYRMKDVVIYVTLFSIGHSITLMGGVLLKIEVNPFLVDAIGDHLGSIGARFRCYFVLTGGVACEHLASRAVEIGAVQLQSAALHRGLDGRKRQQGSRGSWRSRNR
jgi:hypothetical protein